MEHFVRHENKIYAGRHLIIEVNNASRLDDLDHIRSTLLNMAVRIKATVLGEIFHEFPGGGVTGVVALAESHISIHTWPEIGYAAIDVFTCGSCDPNDGISAINEGLIPSTMTIKEIFRGEYRH
jgi:S-adenosylmethionine decarboxylase